MGKPSPHIESGTGAGVAPPPDADAAPLDELLAPDDELPAEVVLQYVGSSRQSWLCALPCDSEPLCNSSAPLLNCGVCAWALGDNSVTAISKLKLRIAIRTPLFVAAAIPTREPPPNGPNEFHSGGVEALRLSCTARCQLRCLLHRPG
jgi:hypothetical protein